MHSLFLFLLLLPLPSPSTSSELPILLSFKNPTWAPLSDTHHCHWPGVTCDPTSGQVTSLSLRSHNLSGAIPTSITSLYSLENLDLSYNTLSGNIPENLTNTKHLTFLDLSFNRLSGRIEVGPGCRNLISLRLSGNVIVGEIPKEIRMCMNLKVLLLDRNVLQGRIPKEIGEFEGLEILDVSMNSLTYRIPKEIGKCKSLRVFVLTDLDGNGEEFNAFVGGIPSEILDIPNLEVLWAPRSNVDGRLVKYVENMCRLRVLNLRLNYVSGQFPKWLVECKELEFVDLSSNYLEGMPPEGLSVECMNYFNVSRNMMFGNLQGVSSHGNCSRKMISDVNVYYRDLVRGVIGDDDNVVLHDFSWNNFSGSLPSLSLKPNRNMSYVMLLNNNRFSESFSYEFFRVCRGLSEFAVNLSSNQIPGKIEVLSTCLQLKSFEASNNKLIGSIPSNTGNLSLLKVLDLSRNSLMGEIPESLSNAKNIQVLLLDHNLFSGKIPHSFSRLAAFDFSFNNFSGEIPKFNHLINCEFFKGNKFLKPCTNSNAIMPSTVPIHAQPSTELATRNNKLKTFTIVSAVSASVIFFVLVILILVLVIGKRKLVRFSSLKQRVVVLFSNTPDKINYESIIRATSNFSIQNLIGTGGFGSTYKAELEPGFLVAVKRLSLVRFQGLQQFDAEIQTLGRIRHKNLVTLIGYHMGEIDTFLIYNYLPGGSLQEFICNMSNDNNVNWHVIHKIALDIAQAIVYLHYSCVPRIVHRDIKPSNILLDDKLNAYLSDFGLARLLEISETHATTDVAGTFGYVAPEYATTCRVSNKADVYSFGVVLLELVSGKRSYDSSFSDYGNGFNIVSFGRLLIQEGRSSEFFCEFLWQNGPKEKLVGMLRLALCCTIESLKVRPSMKQVLETLKQLKS